MSKILDRGETFLRFILESQTSRKQSRFILLNCTDIQLKVIVEIFHNLLKFQDVIPPKIGKLIKKRKRTLVRLIKLLKKKKNSLQKQFISKHFQLIFKVLQAGKRVILNFITFK